MSSSAVGCTSVENPAGKVWGEKWCELDLSREVTNVENILPELGILYLNRKREEWRSEKSTTMAHLPHSLLLKIYVDATSVY